MEKKNEGSIIPSQGNIVRDATLRLKLIGRLMADNRVSFLLKLLPIGSLIYLFSPVDLAPAVVLPVIGALDDAAILWLGAYLFIELCPPELVSQYAKQLVSNNAIVEEVEAEAKKEQDEVIDAEVTDVTDEK